MAGGAALWPYARAQTIAARRGRQLRAALCLLGSSGELPSAPTQTLSAPSAIACQRGWARVSTGLVRLGSASDLCHHMLTPLCSLGVQDLPQNGRAVEPISLGS